VVDRHRSSWPGAVRPHGDEGGTGRLARRAFRSCPGRRSGL